MPYVDQVEAHLVTSRHRVASARREQGNWSVCGSALGRALEFAACAVLIAWGEPYKAEPKMHQVFNERLAPWLDPAISSAVAWVWDHEGRNRPDDVEGLLDGCDRVIDVLATLAASEPPATWQPKPILPAITWTALSDGERLFLKSALSACRLACPGVRLLLFGSRASGTPRPDSDYDLLLIFPDAFPASLYGQCIGEVSALATSLSISADITPTSQSEWASPSIPSRPLTWRIKACNIEVQ